MKRHNEFHELEDALEHLEIRWDEQRKRMVHDKLMKEVSMMSTERTPLRKMIRIAVNAALIIALCIGGYYFVYQPLGLDQQAANEVPSTGSNTAGNGESGLIGDIKQVAVDETEVDKVEVEQQVISVVESFGEQLQYVSLLAPEEVVRESIEAHYGPYVTAELLDQWLENPADAPGRYVSSPWPDRIEIIDVEKVAHDQYQVRGKVIEITSVEEESGGVADSYPIQLIVRKVDDQWLIDEVVMDDETESFTYENSEYGFTLTLPESWTGYEVLFDQWEGHDHTVEVQDTQSGPLILIRHPEWTEENIRQDIPIMVFTHQQWNEIEERKLLVGSGPVSPKELGKNDNYVFALPPRYNYSFPTGYEEVEEILEKEAFQAIDIK